MKSAKFRVEFRAVEGTIVVDLVLNYVKQGHLLEGRKLHFSWKKNCWDGEYANFICNDFIVAYSGDKG